ncbi:MAG: GAF domain-containing sensor histidine kinase [Elusimicrobiota bacterium]|jgi:hypothetical protein
MESVPGVRYIDLSAEEGDLPAGTRVALSRILEEVGAGRSLEETMTFVWKETAALLPRDRIGLAFLDEDGARVVSRWEHADYPLVALRLGYSAGLAGSSLAPILETGRARVIADLEDYLRRRPDSISTRLLLKEGVRSNLTLPLLVGERSVGFLFLSSRRPGAFDDAHARLLLAVRNRLSQAVEKAWLLKRLSESKEAYFSMLGFIAHEMKSPLAAIVARAETYLGGYLGPVDPKAGETLGSVVRIAGYMSNMVRDYLDLTRLENGELRYEPKEGQRLSELLGFAVENSAVWAAQRGSSVRVEGPAAQTVLRGDPELLRILFANLVDNAVKYGFDGIEVLVRVSVEGGRATIAVRNAGVGFTEEQAGKLFKRFSRLMQKGVEDRKGSGLGLYLCWWICQKHGGALTAASEPGAWAEFSARLPFATLEKKD